MVKIKYEGETKNEKFKRLATTRTNEVLRKLRILGNCSNKGVYDYEATEVKKIFDAIEDEVKRVKTLFDHANKKDIEFRL